MRRRCRRGGIASEHRVRLRTNKEAEPVFEEDEATVVKKDRHYGIPLLLVVQLVLCVLVFLAAFGIKTFGGELYNTLHQWYYDNLNDEIIMTESFETFDLDSIFSNEV